MVCSWHPSLEQVPGIWENISWLATLWQNKDTTTIWMRVRGNALMKTTSQLSANTSPRLAVQFSQSVVSDSLRPHRLQHTRFLCPSPTPGACLNSCPSSQWCHPTVSSFVLPFSSCLRSFPASGAFPKNQFFASGSQSIGVAASASVLSMNIQDWSPLGWTGWISLVSKGLSRVFSNTTVQKHQFFGAQLSL